MLRVRWKVLVLLADRPRGGKTAAEKIGVYKEEGRVHQKFTSSDEHDAGFQVDSRVRRPPTRWRDFQLSRFEQLSQKYRTMHTVPWYALVFEDAVLPVVYPHLRDVTFRCSAQYLWRWRVMWRVMSLSSSKLFQSQRSEDPIAAGARASQVQ